MKKKENGKRKLSLILSTCLSLTAVFTGGVSTFAWFQAYGNATLRTTSSNLDLSVEAPDTFELDEPVFYAYSGNGQAGYSGAISGDISNDAALVNFVKLSTDDLKNEYFSIASLVPGHKMSFGIKIRTTNDYSLTSATLALTGYTTINNNYRKVLSAVTDGASGTLGYYDEGVTPKIIRIEDIVRFHGTINTTGAFALGDESSLAGYDTTYTSGTGLRTKSYTDQNYEITTVGSFNAPLDSATIYLFYTIEFSNDSSTWFQEYTEDDSKYYRCYEVIDNNRAANRYFHQDSSHGSSSCYEGLSFRIDQLEVSTF